MKISWFLKYNIEDILKENWILLSGQKSGRELKTKQKYKRNYNEKGKSLWRDTQEICHFWLVAVSRRKKENDLKKER